VYVWKGKDLAGSREPGAGSRGPVAGGREPGAGSRGAGRRGAGRRGTGVQKFWTCSREDIEEPWSACQAAVISKSDGCRLGGPKKKLCSW
jgi:hypothetical protein